MIVGVPKEIKNNENREMWGFFLFLKVLLELRGDVFFDVNGDGVVNVTDIVKMVTIIMSGESRQDLQRLCQF